MTRDIVRRRRLSDFHSHLRSIAQIGQYLFELVVELNTDGYEYVVVEPNTYLDPAKPKEHVETAWHVDRYRQEIERAKSERNTCKILLLAKLTPRTTPQIIRDAARAGAVGFKLYPDGVTTGSEGGVDDFFSKPMLANYATLEREGLVLQLHPERPGRFCLRREFEFHEIITRIVKEYPGLRVFVEHITDRRTVELLRYLRLVRGYQNVFGTFTGHHLVLTLDDVLGRVDHHCWPCAKYPEDRDALLAAALSGEPWWISITDSAPHEWKTKHEADCACAGVFNPFPIAAAQLFALFEKHAALDKFEVFTSVNGLRAYNLPLVEQNNVLVFKRATWEVPALYGKPADRLTPFLAKSKLEWHTSSEPGPLVD